MSNYKRSTFNLKPTKISGSSRFWCSYIIVLYATWIQLHIKIIILTLIAECCKCLPGSHCAERALSFWTNWEINSWLGILHQTMDYNCSDYDSSSLYSDESVKHFVSFIIVTKVMRKLCRLWIIWIYNKDLLN